MEGTPIVYDLYVVCVPVLIVTPNDQGIVINNQNQCDLWLPLGIAEGKK